MKIAFWVVGASCSGKSYYGKKIADNLQSNLVYLDTVLDRINFDKLSKKEGYEVLFRNKKDVVVLEGIIPFTFSEDMKIVSEILKDYKIIYVLINPDYLEYIKRVNLRRLEIPNSNPIELSEQSYYAYLERIKDILGRCIEIKTDEDLRIISLEQIRNLNYQHNGFTDIKFRQLKVEPKDKSVLDLGCSACMFEDYFMKAGAKKYTGLDVNLSYLINKNAHCFNLNELEKWNKKADIVVCSSVLHYIHDKEKFIKECSRLTKELFVLETPLATEEGSRLLLGNRGLYFPTVDLLEEWLGKYFKDFKRLGTSIVEDRSFRLIYHCKV